ncbi:MAG: Rid family hydrolase [Desulfobacterales bacterium]|nr:Rid family hydrolase [Desulfobacterales bacterium]
MKRTVANPRTLFDSRQFGFSQVAVAKPGTHIFVSGQVAWDENLEIVGPNDLAVQTRKSLDNLDVAVRSTGGTMEDIVIPLSEVES